MSYGDELRFYLRIARRRLPYFVIPLIVVASAGCAVVMSLPAVYSSSGKILVESQQIPTDFVKSTVTALATERLQVIQQRVLTRENLLGIADKFNLFAGKKDLTRSDLLDLMRARTTFQILDLGTTGGTRTRPRREESLTVVFSVGFDYERAEIAARVANELVTIVLNEDIEGRTARATETTNFLTRENERLAEEMKKLDGTIAVFKLKNSATLPEKLNFNMALQEKQQLRIAEIERDLRSLAESKRLLELESSIRGSQTPGAPPPGSAEQELQKLTRDYEQGLSVYSENHPEMRKLKKLITAKSEALEREKAARLTPAALNTENPALSADQRLLAEKLTSIDSQVALLEQQREQVRASNERLQETILITPQVGAELSSLERRREALQRSLDDMAIKLSQARLGERMEENQQAEKFEVIEAPIVPQEPVRPKRLPLLLLVAAAALGSGAAAAGGAEFLDGTVKRSSDVTQKLNLRLLSVIPVIPTRADKRRRRLRYAWALLALTLLVSASLAAIHFLYQPLDFLALRLAKALSELF